MQVFPCGGTFTHPLPFPFGDPYTMGRHLNVGADLTNSLHFKLILCFREKERVREEERGGKREGKREEGEGGKKETESEY